MGWTPNTAGPPRSPARWARWSFPPAAGCRLPAAGCRLAPEHPCLAALDDCCAAVVWPAESVGELGADPVRIAVCGQSAGGGLATTVALPARDRGGPALVFQALGIPELADRLLTESMRTCVDTPVWHRRNVQRGSAFSPVDRTCRRMRRPRGRTDPAGLPPAHVTASQFDPLRDEALPYARRLAQANVSVELHLYPGTCHGATFVATAQVSRWLTADSIGAFRRVL
ncbi:alpha/beta hydrolase fold domain-containing protein [Amycolatopsis sp. NPDC023774]|uniref:alpha/beta hydrolase fold domain-containing protein n=1 Tax=Amycolatopsis sp. NPDC023774 TaxID=3155015 RepID=UPI0033E58238